MGIFDFFKKKEKKEDVDIHVLEQDMNQRLFNVLQEYLPNGWEEVVLFAGYYREDSGYFKYWVKLENGEYIDCFNLIPPPQQDEEDELQKQLMKFHRISAPVRNKMKWVCMIMSVTNQGKLSKNYDYAEGVEEENLKQYIEDFKNELNKKYQ